MFSYGPLHMDLPVLANQQELIYIYGVIGFTLEDLLGVIDNRDGQRERSQENPHCPCDMKIMICSYLYFCKVVS